MSATTTATLTTRNGQGAPEAGVAFTFQIVEGPAGDGESYDQAPFTVASDVDGVLSVTLVRGAWYRARRGVGDWALFRTPEAATFSLPQLNGTDA